MTQKKIYMLNALWFKQEGGEEKYAEYLRAAQPFVQEVGGRLVSGPFQPDLAVIGEWDPDLILIVEYPSWEDFLRLPEDAGYQAIAHLREEALEKSLLLRCHLPAAG
jgi:uncharacterized protein (DUF1330 family)